MEDLLTASDVDADVVWNMTTKAGSGIITLKGKNSAGSTKIIRMKIVLENPAASASGVSVS